MRSRQPDLKPILAWLPSQYGFLPEPPQRHSQASVVRCTVRPVPDTTSSGPLTFSGPSWVG